jgi:hypothetical protein
MPTGCDETDNMQEEERIEEGNARAEAGVVWHSF